MAENETKDASNPTGNRQRADAAQAAGGPPADAPRHHSLDQNGTGYTPEEAASESAERAGQNRQSATGGASAGHYSDFVASSPESNVFPAGAAQTSHGSAGHPIPGGTTGAAGAGGGTDQGAMSGAAGGGEPGNARDGDTDQ